MDVHFICKKSNSCVGFVSNENGEIVDKINAVGGKYSTSDKRKLKKLLGSSWGIQNFKLAEGQNEEAISRYLETGADGKLESHVTQEMLSAIPFNGYKILSEKLKTKHKFPHVGLIQTELVDKPLSTEIETAISAALEYLPAKGEDIAEPEDEEDEDVEDEEDDDPAPKKKTTKKKAATPAGKKPQKPSI
jgi:hypothetical protein